MSSNTSFPEQSTRPLKSADGSLPWHVAIIMDGNGRWAKKRLLNRVKGHERGMNTVREIVTAGREMGIGILTLYAFSTENWQRPKYEVSALMSILRRFLKSEQTEMTKNNIRLNVIGQPDRLPKNVQKVLLETLALTADNSGMVLNLALSYGGRDDITQMVRTIAKKAIAGKIDIEAIDEQLITDHLYTAGLADPDLVIRTSGEMRISNFLLWQIAYSELFITNTLWPDFNKAEFVQILHDYEHRDRRFGKV